MKSSIRMGLLLALLLSHVAASAQIYMCKDRSGRTLTSDRPIPECADRPMREFDRTGLARREIPAPPTAEQKREMLLQEEKRKADEAAAQEQRRNDNAIRLRYRNEADIELARKRSVEIAQEQIKRETSLLAAAQTRRQKAQAEVDARKNKNQAVPADLQRRVEESDRTISESKKIIRNAEAEIEQINAKYDETAKRFRVITGVASAK